MKQQQAIEIFGAAEERERYLEGIANIKAQMSFFFQDMEGRTMFKVESANTTITHAPVVSDGSLCMIYIQTTVLFSY